MKEFLEFGEAEFSRKIREGDNDKTKNSIYLKKKYSPLLNMKDFDSLLNEFKKLIES